MFGLAIHQFFHMFNESLEAVPFLGQNELMHPEPADRMVPVNPPHGSVFDLLLQANKLMLIKLKWENGSCFRYLHFSINRLHVIIHRRLSIELHMFVRSVLLVIRHEKVFQLALELWTRHRFHRRKIIEHDFFLGDFEGAAIRAVSASRAQSCSSAASPSAIYFPASL